MPIANFYLSRDDLLESYHFIDLDQYAYLRPQRLKPPAVFEICAITVLFTSTAILPKFKSTWITLQSLTGHIQFIKRAPSCLIRRTPATRQNGRQYLKHYQNDHTSINTYPTPTTNNKAEVNGDLPLPTLPHKPTQQSQTSTSATHQWNDIVDKWDPPANKSFLIPTLKQLAHTALQIQPVPFCRSAANKVTPAA